MSGRHNSCSVLIAVLALVVAAMHNTSCRFVVGMRNFKAIRGKIVDDAKARVTVNSVRAANGKMMSAGKGATPPPATPTPRVASTLRDVATGGQRAMQALKKK